MMNNPRLLYFNYQFLRLIFGISLMTWPIDVLRNIDNESSARIVTAYVVIVLLPLSSIHALYEIIKSKSYKEVF